MYRPKPQNQVPQGPPTQRLPKLQAIPSVKDLEFAFRESEKLNVHIELPWGPEGTSGYLLSIQPGEEPVWAMFEGAQANDTPLWKHASRDIGLIQNLITQSCPDDIGMALAAKPAAVITGSHGFLPPADSSKATLQGRLENMQITSLLQSIQMSKMTGRLQLFDQGNVANAYFLDGSPVHATTVEGTGDQAIVEIMIWEKGEFRFFPDENVEERTVKKRIESLIMEGITLLDQYKYLAEQGLKADSYLIRREARISPEEFKMRLANGAPLDFNSQKYMYELCDARTRWQDLLSRRPMTKLEWVPLLFNLTSCGLVSISDFSPYAPVTGAGAGLDRNMIAGVLRSLTRAETGFYTYPALQFFLEYEFAKSQSLGMPLSLLVFETRIFLNNEKTPTNLPIPALRELALRIEALKRPFDILAHYETFDFAILLPGANAKAARLFGHKVTETLLNLPLMQGQTQRLLLAGGLVSTPEDTIDISQFLSSVREAKNRAKEARVPLKSVSES